MFIHVKPKNEVYALPDSPGAFAIVQNDYIKINPTGVVIQFKGKEQAEACFNNIVRAMADREVVYTIDEEELNAEDVIDNSEEQQRLNEKIVSEDDKRIAEEAALELAKKDKKPTAKQPKKADAENGENTEA